MNVEGGEAYRRAEERRQKILSDINLIKKRRQHEVDIPVSPGHDQPAWFVRLESNGIWENVFQYLTHPSDISSAYFACELFRDHLEKKRIKAVAPEVVFGILRDKNYVQFSWKKDKDENAAILNLRVVSKAWKAAFEEQFLLAPLQLNRPKWFKKFWEDQGSGSQCSMVWDWYEQVQCEFTSVEDVNKAIEALGLGSGSGDSGLGSCLIRTIMVNDKLFPGAPDREVFYSRLAHFLDIHGDSIWGCMFYQRGLSDEASFLQMVRDMMSRMPCLDSVVLCGAES